MKIPSNITALAEKHAVLLEHLNFDPAMDDPARLNHPDIFLESGLFTAEAVDVIFGGGERIADPVPVAAEPEDGLILIRPELTHITTQFEEFIAKHYSLTDSKAVEVTPEMYWALYEESIITKDSPLSRFSRAAGFIGSICNVLTFSGCAKDQRDTPTADYVYTHLKGRQAVANPGTLRGDVVYNEAIRLGFHSLDNPQIAQSVDPYGAYRKIIETSEWGYLRRLTHSVLFFTGVGVHVPNYAELGKDARALDV